MDAIKARVVYTAVDWSKINIDPTEHIRYSCDNVKARIVPPSETSDEPIAIVGYGPSLQDTWEEIKDFKVIWTCSGAHKFLIDRGIIPTYHVDSDPRGHKPKMLGEPHKDVTYLISSICHPSYFDKLKGFNVILWHILFYEPASLFEALPSGEWIISGGGTIGQRTVTIARVFGFKNVHLFGFDGNAKGSAGKRYAGEHLGTPEGLLTPFVNDGQIFYTTEHWSYQVNQFFEHMDRILPDVKYTFHGDGLMASVDATRVKESCPFSPKAVMK